MLRRDRMMERNDPLLRYREENMQKRKFLTLIFCAVPFLATANLVVAQNYPDKPVRIITSGVGGGADRMSRILEQGVAPSLGQPIVVENRTSSGAVEAVANADADGYTVLVTGGSFWVGPLMRDTSYDPVADFVPVSWLSQSPQVIVVTPSLPVNTVEELIALAKEKPGELNYGSGSPGGNTHLAGELFKKMSGTDIVNIPFKSGANQLQALMAGDIHIAFDSVSSVADQVKAGTLRAIAVTSARPSSLMPGMPTVAEAVPGYEMVSRRAMFAPAGTPEDVIVKLNKEIAAYLSTDAAKELIISQGEEAIGSSPEELAAAMEGEMGRLGQIIEELGLRTN